MISPRHLFVSLLLGVSLLLPFGAAAQYPNCNPMTSTPCNMPEGQADFCATASTVSDQKMACENIGGGQVLTSAASTAGGMSCAANRTPCQVDGTNFCANGGASACNAANGEVITSANPNPDPAPTPGTPTDDATTTSTSTDAGSTAVGGGTLLNPLGVDSLEDLLTAVLGAVVQIGSIFLVLALVWVGFLFVFAQGNEEKIKTARQALFWTIIGGLVLLGAQAISMVIQATAEAL